MQSIQVLMPLVETRVDPGRRRCTHAVDTRVDAGTQWLVLDDGISMIVLHDATP